MKWRITYYSEKVFRQIEKLPKPLRARYITLTKRMKSDGPNLGIPHTSAMGNGLFEIRMKAKVGIARAFYCVQIGNEILVLHSFIKKTQETPKKELGIARKRLQEVKDNE